MHLKQKNFIIPLIGILLFAFLLMLSCVQKNQWVEVQEGMVDLSDWQHEDALLLGGTWLFYKGQLYDDTLSDASVVPVPHLWTHDITYGTYVAKITGLRPLTSYEISLRDAGTAYALFVNGHLVLSNGKVAPDPSDYVPYSRFEHGSFVTDPFGEAEIMISIANFDIPGGGFWENIHLSSTAFASKHYHRLMLISALISGWLIALSVFFISLHLLSRKEQKGLVLGLFSLLIAFRTLITNQRILLYLLPDLPWHLTIKLDYAMGMILFPVFGLLLTRMDFVKRIKWVDISLFSSVIILLGTSTFLSVSSYLIVFEVFKYLLIIVSPYFIYMIMNGVYQRTRGAISFMMASLVLLAAVVLELYFANNQMFLLYASFMLINLLTIIFAEDFILSKALNQTLEDTLIIDPLTTAYNRLFLNQMIETNGRDYISSDHALVLFVDFNMFKQTNDTHGHVVGDQILIEITARMREFFADKAYITRYGGDEFVIIYPTHAHQDVQRLIDALKAYVASPMTIFNQSFVQTISVGYAFFNRHEDQLEDIIKASDHDMYLKKTVHHTNMKIIK